MRIGTTGKLAAGLLLALGATAASAAVVDVNVDGIESWDGEGSAFNTVLVVDVANLLGAASGSAVTIDGLGWDVTIDTLCGACVGTSWLNEAVVSYGPVGGPAQVFLTPGAGDGMAGTMSYSSGGIVDLTDVGIPDIVLADGLLQLEFFEDFDDGVGELDAVWAGSLSLSATGPAAIPVPAALPLLLSALGFGGLLGARRKH